MILDSKLWIDVLDLLAEATAEEWPHICRACRRVCDRHEDRTGAALFAGMAAYSRDEIAGAKARLEIAEDTEPTEAGGAEAGL